MTAPLPLVALHRRVLAEGLGTGFLVATVVGSGVAASRLSPGDVGMQLLENGLATGAALMALVLALHPVSAAFNPIVSLVEAVLGLVTWADTAALAAAQVVGAGVGAVVADLMFGLPAVTVSGHHRDGPGLLLGEVVATVGLLLVVLGTARSGRPERVGVAVGGYIAAAYWFTSSTSFANPAVTLARTLSDTFAGIAPASAAFFVGAQLVGAAIAVPLIRLLHPRSA